MNSGLRDTTVPPIVRHEAGTVNRPFFVSLALILGIMSLSSRSVAQNGATPTSIAPAQAQLEQVLGGLHGPGFAIASSDAMGLLAAADEEGYICLWDKDTLLNVRNAAQPAYAFKAHDGPAIGLAWNGAVLASAGGDNRVKLWSMPYGRLLRTLDAKNSIGGIVLPRDGASIAWTEVDSKVVLADVAAANKPQPIDVGGETLTAIVVSHDGRQLAVAGADGKITVVEIASRKQILQVAVPVGPQLSLVERQVVALAVSPDGNVIAAGMADGTINVFDRSTGKQIRKQAGHTGSVTCLKYHWDGAFLFSSSRDRTIRIWNVKDGALVKTLEGHESWVQGIEFLTGGSRLASVSADRTVRIWTLGAARKQ